MILRHSPRCLLIPLQRDSAGSSLVSRLTGRSELLSLFISWRCSRRSQKILKKADQSIIFLPQLPDSKGLFSSPLKPYVRVTEILIYRRAINASENGGSKEIQILLPQRRYYCRIVNLRHLVQFALTFPILISFQQTGSRRSHHPPQKKEPIEFYRRAQAKALM
jgi:hypothetical protein